MSLAGPRPLEAELVGHLPGHLLERRAAVRPGLTGLWQVSGRSTLALEEALVLGSGYVSTWSMGPDLRILLLTSSRAVLGGEGAY